jgi:hypothetical protein
VPPPTKKFKVDDSVVNEMISKLKAIESEIEEAEHKIFGPNLPKIPRK